MPDNNEPSERQVTLTASCLCRAHVFTAKVPSSSLPLELGCCHCNSCRRLTGSLYRAVDEWPVPASDVDITRLRKYTFSPKMDEFSCRSCSGPIFTRATASGKLYVWTGSLDAESALAANGEPVARYDCHMWVGDTLDGGASTWLRRDGSGRPISRWRGAWGTSEEFPPDWEGEMPLTTQSTTKATPARSNIRCHCGGVDFVLRSAVDFESGGKDLPPCVEPGTFKYKGVLDACEPCRRSFGADLVAWVAVPLSHLEFASGSSGEQEEFPATTGTLKQATDDNRSGLGTLAYFKSSEKVERYFCSICAACVFYARQDNPAEVDVAAGMLFAEKGGARMESLVAWRLDRGILWKEETRGSWREALIHGVEVDLNDAVS